MNKKQLGIYLAIGGGALLIIGSFMTWVKVTVDGLGSGTVSGTSGGDGWYTVVAGVLAALGGILVMRLARKRLAWLSVGGGVLGAAIVVYEFFDLKSGANDLFSSSYGIGLYVCLAGAIAALAGGILAANAPAGVDMASRTPAAATTL